MFASSISLTASRWRRVALLALLAAALLLAVLTPMHGGWLLAFLLLWFLFAWQWWQSWQYREASQTLLLGESGDIRWLPAQRPAGVLKANSLVLPWAIQLCWQSSPEQGRPPGQTHRYWLLADQCSDADFRAVARAIRQCRWQQLGPD